MDNIQNKKVEDNFIIKQLKIEHFHTNTGKISPGFPISTSIEIKKEYNKEQRKMLWQKTVIHKYFDIYKAKEIITDKYIEELKDAEKFIAQIEKNDLRKLKNNYFTDKHPESFSHWELSYNNYFKIAGTYNQVIEEFKQIVEILEIKKIIGIEKKKVFKKLKELRKN